MPDPRISRTFIGQSPIARNLPARITPSFHNVNSFVTPCRWAIRFCMRNVCWKCSVSASAKSCASARDLKLAQHRKRVFLREKTFRGGGESHSCSRFWGGTCARSACTLRNAKVHQPGGADWKDGPDCNLDALYQSERNNLHPPPTGSNNLSSCRNIVSLN